jgi:hypothetical protein
VTFLLSPLAGTAPDHGWTFVRGVVLVCKVFGVWLGILLLLVLCWQGARSGYARPSKHRPASGRASSVSEERES